MTNKQLSNIEGLSGEEETLALRIINEIKKTDLLLQDPNTALEDEFDWREEPFSNFNEEKYLDDAARGAGY